MPQSHFSDNNFASGAWCRSFVTAELMHNDSNNGNMQSLQETQQSNVTGNNMQSLQETQQSNVTGNLRDINALTSLNLRLLATVLLENNTLHGSQSFTSLRSNMRQLYSSSLVGYQVISPHIEPFMWSGK
jgi:hypothetical protein